MLVVYWIDPDSRKAHYLNFDDSNESLIKALDSCRELTSNGMLCVTTKSHDSTPGGIVKDGKLPSGEPYEWKKRRL